MQCSADFVQLKEGPRIEHNQIEVRSNGYWLQNNVQGIVGFFLLRSTSSSRYSPSYGKAGN